MTPDDEAVVGAVIGYKAGKAATPIMLPVMGLAVAAGVWNFWLGPVMVRFVAATLPFLILLTAVAVIWAGWSAMHRLQGRMTPGLAGRLAMVPLKWSLGFALVLGVMVQFGFDHPRVPVATQVAAPVSAGH